MAAHFSGWIHAMFGSGISPWLSIFDRRVVECLPAKSLLGAAGFFPETAPQVAEALAAFPNATYKLRKSSSIEDIYAAYDAPYSSRGLKGPQNHVLLRMHRLPDDQDGRVQLDDGTITEFPTLEGESAWVLATSLFPPSETDLSLLGVCMASDDVYDMDQFEIPDYGLGDVANFARAQLLLTLTNAMETPELEGSQQSYFRISMLAQHMPSGARRK